MKKVLAVLMMLTLVLGFLPAGVVAQEDGCDCEAFEEVTLYAGQDMDVGTVTVTNDDEKVCVTYALDDGALDEGWLLYETHLYVGDCSFDGTLTRENSRLGEPYNANPIPGQFPYGDDELGGVAEWTYCISFDDLGFGICDEVCVAAHAVVERFAGYGGAASAVLFGNIGGYGEGQGDIWAIDPVDRSETQIFESPDISFQADWYPNALAYDEDNHRLYFTTGQNTLLFYDFSDDQGMNALTDASGNVFTNDDNVLGATWGEGAYWYVLNRSDKLYRVDFDGDGIATELTEYEMPTEGKTLTQGDIVYDDGVIFGSSGTGAGGLRGFFTYNIAAEDFKVVREEDSSFAAPQLAWGLDADGEKVLYGTLGGDEQTLWTIDTDSGEMTQVTVAADSPEPFFTENRYQDLASRFIYDEVFESETAWGEGYRFNERGNWGMYFTYKICEPCDEWIVYGSNLGDTASPLGFDETSSDAIFAIDLKNKSVSVAYDPGNVSSDQNYPNGNAYDPLNQWLFFATDDGNLYFYDMVQGTQHGPFDVGGQIASGAWYDGHYYYVPQGSKALYKFNVNKEGATATQVGTLGKALNYGDIVFDIDQPGVLFGSGGGDSGYYFTYDLNDNQYTELKSGVPHKQLAYASNGVLYGVTALGGDWYEINPETGADKLFWEGSTYNGHTITLTDLADGPQCE